MNNAPDKTTEYDALIMITPADFLRLQKNYRFLVETMPARRVLFVGSEKVGEHLKEAGLTDKAGFLCEDDILPFDSVHALMKKRLAPYLEGRELPRGMTGWYYQQFLKMQYARKCPDAYYMVWDGDTIPCKSFPVFDKDGVPFMDLKKEFHKEYFETIEKLFPGMTKSSDHSFIAEHMLVDTRIMNTMLSDIEANGAIEGELFWEKILCAIEPEKLKDTAFSEFETYGTYCSYRFKDSYRLRRWYSFRLGGSFFDPDAITKRDYDWLGKDFYAISFEKNQSVREDHKNLFDNPDYQAKLSAKQMLLIAQDTFTEGYIESWDEDDEEQRILKEAMEKSSDDINPGSPLEYLDAQVYREYKKLGDGLCGINDDQAYLCYENAAFLCPDEKEKSRLLKRCDDLKQAGRAKVEKTAIVILSYNNTYLMQRCIESIYTNCCPDAYTLIVLDNASDDGVTQWLKGRPDDGMILLLSDENMGFAAGCNAAASYAPAGQDILLLNNDTRMCANSLFWLRMGLYSDEKTGASGAYQNYSDNGQLLDVSFSLPEQYMRFGAKRNVISKYALTKRCRLSGFAMLVRRSAWDEAGGFDEQFSPGYFEDDDLSFTLMKKGYELVLCENCFIYHAGSQSFRTRTDLEAIFERNRIRFAEKWGVDSREYEESWKPEDEDDDAVKERAKRTKLIIWDLDDTLWKGILSEEKITPQKERNALVKAAADRGIVNGICSKNDEETALKTLKEEGFDGIDTLFVFPSIDWTPKAGRVSGIISDMALRAENTLFIDDDPLQLREVGKAEPDIMTAFPWELPEFERQLMALPVTDPEHKRTESYRILEKKKEARAQQSDNTAFLRESDIHIRLIRNCEEHIDRVCELISRTNQLNFTKIRLDESQVAALLKDGSYECALVEAYDRYGNYGIIGFYALKTGEEKTLEHFLFSCRTLGMGIEKYLYQKLGCPKLVISGQVAARPDDEGTVDWITEDETGPGDGMTVNGSAGENAAGSGDADSGAGDNKTGEAEVSGRVMMKGPCDLVSMLPYMKYQSLCELETNFVDSRGIVVAGSNNSLHLYEVYHTPVPVIREALADAPFMTETDFITFMFDEPADIVVFSTLSEMHSGIYTHKKTGVRICFGSCRFDLTDKKNRQAFISGEAPGHNVPFTDELLDRFAESYEFTGSLSPEEAAANIKWMREKLPESSLLVLLLGSETEAENNKEEFADHAPLYAALNRELEKTFENDENVVLLNVTDLIKGQESFEDATNHYSKEVYHSLAGILDGMIEGRLKK